MALAAQFINADGIATSALKGIRRVYVQDGKVIQNSKTNVPVEIKIKCCAFTAHTLTRLSLPGLDAYDSIMDQFCAAQKMVFWDAAIYAQRGGMATMDKSCTAGVVPVISIWDDHAANMLWLDSDYSLV
ncbi:hypothetical protein BDV93DRAFT_558746 [Ceratobasidium sp. AG-I]|nr:hypothetical protein BDV93DRAFT_558746 [Ceratobasidium sp. AG-I]